MAKKENKNILDFCNSSQRLFTITWVLMIFIVTIILLTNSKTNYSAIANLVPFSPMPFVILGLAAMAGSFACRRILEYTEDNNHDMALKKSNAAHRYQVISVIILFIIFTSISFMLLFYIAAYFMRDNATGESLYRSLIGSGVNRAVAYQQTAQSELMTGQKIISIILETVISFIVCIVFIVRYMKILISSDIARKSFLDTKTDLKKAIKKESSKKSPQKQPSQKVEYSDDDDENDL